MKKIFIIALTSFTFIQCTKQENNFLIKDSAIGQVQKNFTIKQIDSVLKNDSIVKQIDGDAFTGNFSDIEIFEKGGKHLLSLSPTDASDNNTKINIVTIRDPRYKTKEGVGLNNIYKDFKDNYEVSKIDRILNNINIEFKNEDFYITISIDELPSEYKYDYNRNIESVSIPDNAKIKNLRLDWF